MEPAVLGTPLAIKSARGSRKTHQRQRKNAHRAGPAAEKQPLQQPLEGLALTVAGAAAGLLVTLLGRTLRGGHQRFAGNLEEHSAATIDASGALAAAVARAPSLEVLSWDVCGNYAEQLSRWAQPGALPLLRSLTFFCHFELEVPRALRDGLPALRELHIIEDVFGPDHTRPYEQNGSGIRLAAGCLPAGLQQLEIVAAGMLILPPATLTACTQLTELSISTRGQPMLVPVNEIVQLRSLRRLRVGEDDPSINLLGSLAQLTQLTTLDCSAALGQFRHSSAKSRSHTAIIRALRVLTANPPMCLRELPLGGLNLLRLPQEVLTIPSLEVLHLERNPYVQLGRGQAELECCSLRHITLEVAAIQRNLEVLRCMPELADMQITVCGPTTEYDRSALNIILSDEAGFKNAVAVWFGPGPTARLGKRIVDILKERHFDVWGPKVLARQQRLVEGRQQARRREHAGLVEQLAVGAAAGAATGAAVHFVQRLCMR